MRAKDLDGREYTVAIGKYLSNSNKCSSLHNKCRQLLTELYPTLNIVEEIPIRIRKGKTLFLDFFIPLQKLAIEVNGQQHYKHNSLFHGTDKFGLIQQRINDIHKRGWCDINNIKLVTLSYDNIKSWKKLLKI